MRIFTLTISFLAVLMTLCGENALGQSMVRRGPTNINGHDYVDLGLPSRTLWSTTNVGAEEPEESGDYCAWGETDPKKLYTDHSSKTTGKEVVEYGGDNTYDAATNQWGWPWRTPTAEQLDELKDNCDFFQTTRNGVSGVLVKSRLNGKTIFLPECGMRVHDKKSEVAEQGFYWSCTPEEDSTSTANVLCIFNGIPSQKNYQRYVGCMVRPVVQPQQKDKIAKIKDDNVEKVNKAEKVGKTVKGAMEAQRPEQYQAYNRN